MYLINRRNDKVLHPVKLHDNAVLETFHRALVKMERRLLVRKTVVSILLLHSMTRVIGGIGSRKNWIMILLFTQGRDLHVMQAQVKLSKGSFTIV